MHPRWCGEKKEGLNHEGHEVFFFGASRIRLFFVSFVVNQILPLVTAANDFLEHRVKPSPN